MAAETVIGRKAERALLDEMLASSEAEMLALYGRIFDRADGVINLCELKYGRDRFVVTKKYAAELKTKVETFEHVTKTRKKVVLTLVCPLGLEANAWSKDLVDRVVTIDALL